MCAREIDEAMDATKLYSPADYGVFFQEDIRAYLRIADSDRYDRAGNFSYGKFRSWSEKGFYNIEVADWSRRRRYISFGEMLTARMVSLLRGRRVSLGKIRKAHEFLRDATGDEFPFVAKPVWTDAAQFSDHVYAYLENHPVAADLFGQIIFPNLREIEQVRDAGLKYSQKSAGEERAAKWEIVPGVMIDPMKQGGVPCVKGRRLPTSVLRASLDDGLSVRKICSAFRVDEPTVKLALDWERQLSEARAGAVAT